MSSMSKGEIKVANLLRRGGIQFQQEISFKDLHGSNGYLRYDFGVFKNGKLICCIEVDGKQHFLYTPHFHKNILGFTKQKERDIKKNRYCLIHHIPLIRIPYWEIETLTLQKLFSEQRFIVKDKMHNINLIKQGVRK